MEAIKLIVHSCRRLSVPAEVIEIETLKDTSFNNADVVFFLTNDQRVGRFVTDLSLGGVKVINSAYLVGNRTKSYAQQQVRAAGVPIPRLTSNIDLRRLEIEKDVGELGFPLYIKSENHILGVLRAKNMMELNHITAELDPSVGWYLEKAVDAPERHHDKLYWVAGTYFGHDRQQAPARADMVKAMNIIGEVLFFDAFSADFIVGESDYWCIDVNPAPGMFGSEAAREALIGLIRPWLAVSNELWIESSRSLF